MKKSSLSILLFSLMVFLSLPACDQTGDAGREESVQESLRKQDDQEARARLNRLKMHVKETYAPQDSTADSLGISTETN
ncbi:MAG: hypothetical protein NWR72_08710 [Bacteroidia bacterium]|nr:hypothetical protein [Bacteroidia bacterium]